MSCWKEKVDPRQSPFNSSPLWLPFFFPKAFRCIDLVLPVFRQVVKVCGGLGVRDFLQPPFLLSDERCRLTPPSRRSLESFIPLPLTRADFGSSFGSMMSCFPESNFPLNFFCFISDVSPLYPCIPIVAHWPHLLFELSFSPRPGLEKPRELWAICFPPLFSIQFVTCKVLLSCYRSLFFLGESVNQKPVLRRAPSRFLHRSLRVTTPLFSLHSHLLLPSVRPFPHLPPLDLPCLWMVRGT